MFLIDTFLIKRRVYNQILQPPDVGFFFTMYVLCWKTICEHVDGESKLVVCKATNALVPQYLRNLLQETLLTTLLVFEIQLLI